MDLRRMALIDAPLTNVSATKMDSYKLGADKLKIIEDTLPALMQREFWDPVFQAWRPFIDTYLSSGVNPQLAAQYYGDFVRKDDYLNAPPAAYSNLFAEVLKMKNTSGTVVFDGVFYSDIYAFCENPCKFFISTQKVIANQLYSADIYIQTLTDLLNLQNWRAVMCGLVLYRHCQIDGFSWPTPLILQLQDRLGEWLETFLATFDTITDFVGPGNAVYTWYQPKVKEVIQRVWATSLHITGRPLVITEKDVYSVSPEVATKLVKYVNSSPAVYDDPFDEQTVWDSMSALFYARDPQDPKLAEQAYKAPCVPRSYLKKMCNTLYDFYWTVKDGLLTSQLYTRKEVEWSANRDSEMSPADYLEDLYNRGFPSM